MKKDLVEVMAYYFPQYHQDSRNDELHGAGWTEWDLLRNAKPRFSGHRQPITPAWGEFDESDPVWAAKEIDLAADHGITGFIYDWYWYDGKPFLEAGLEQGFLQAPNRNRLKFALMWANHDWVHLFPNKAGVKPELLMSGSTNRESFSRQCDYVIKHYFSQANYYCINREPYYSLYELGTFIKGMGGVQEAHDALEEFRAKVKAAGFPGLHLNGIVWGVTVLPTELKLDNPREVVQQLGFSSITSYAWVHHFDLNNVNTNTRPYIEAAKANYAVWEEYATAFGIPYYASVSMGWDPSPRTAQDTPFKVTGYPWTAILEGNTPAAFQTALERAKSHALKNQTPMITINAWNEWTEGSYLLPDTVEGTGYLGAIQNIFAQSAVAAD
jgi:hypothetical protein